MLKLKLDLRKITSSQSKSERAKTVLSEREVPVGTSKEEKRFAAGQIWSGGERALRKSSKSNQQGFITLIVAIVTILIAVIVIAYLRVKKAQL